MSEMPLVIKWLLSLLATFSLVGSSIFAVQGVSFAASESASALATGALNNARSAGWVHEETKTSLNGVLRASMVNDIGTHEGRQIVTLPGGGRAEVIALDQVHQMYVRANQIGLVNYFGFTASLAAKYTDKWLELTPSDSG